MTRPGWGKEFGHCISCFLILLFDLSVRLEGLHGLFVVHPDLSESLGVVIADDLLQRFPQATVQVGALGNDLGQQEALNLSLSAVADRYTPVGGQVSPVISAGGPIMGVYLVSGSILEAAGDSFGTTGRGGVGHGKEYRFIHKDLYVSTINYIFMQGTTTVRVNLQLIT